MKLVCSVLVGNQLLPSLAINSKKRYAISTLALCKHPKSEDFSIILFSEQNKNGTKYEVKNISKVLTRFLNEGKATIQFQKPPHDLYIQADTVLLKAFLNLLKQAIFNKLPEKAQFSNLAVTHQKSAVKRLQINEINGYPAKGLPRTLNILHINNLSRSSLDKEVLRLVHLRILDISNNSLESLPIELTSMPSLNELNVSYNRLGQATTLKQWAWLGNNPNSSLKVLNMTHNSLTCLPYTIVKLKYLRILHIDYNELKYLPPGIGILKNLRTLTVANNKLCRMPASARRLRLQTLDIADNSWDDENVRNVSSTNVVKSLPMFSLREHALRRVLHSKLEFTPNEIPYTLIEELQSAEYCSCGSACFNAFIKHMETISILGIAQNVNTCLFGAMIPFDSYFCSFKCFQIHNSKRRRRIVR